MLIRLGIIVLVFATMAADSPSLLAPASLFAIGVALVLIGRRLEDGEDRQR